MNLEKRAIALTMTVLMLLSTMMLLGSEDASGDYSRGTSLARAHASFLGEAYNDYSGISAEFCGDVNGDGYDDILIGAYNNDDAGYNRGKTYLIFGMSGGFSIDTLLDNPDASFVGEADSDGSGRSVAGVGDVNGDGYDDILIGAPFNDDGGLNSGKAYLIFGKNSDWETDMDLSDADVEFYGEASYDESGEFVSGTGDVNGDGYDDILIGTVNNDEAFTNSGKVYLILGRGSGWRTSAQLSISDASFRGETASDEIGAAIDICGDVNGDGYDDILIGTSDNDEAGSNTGQSYLIFGKASGWAGNSSVSSSDASFRGESTGDESGVALSGVGDVNGDGYDDLMITAWLDDDGGTDAGQVYMILGKSTGWSMDTSLSSADGSYIGETTGDRIGLGLSRAGDINGDGYDDMLLSSRLIDDPVSNAGKTYLVLGKGSGWALDSTLTNVEASFIGESTDDYSGMSISGGGDVNGDGNPDILISSPYNDEFSTSAGQTYLFLTNALPPAPRNLEALPSMDGGSISIQWQRPFYWNYVISAYRVFRSTDGFNYHQTASIPSTTRSYTDTDVTIGTTYYYAARAVDVNGLISPMSRSARILCETDTDGDGIGDSIDSDDDNDGIPDSHDADPYTRDPFYWSRSNIDLGDIGIKFYGEDVNDFSGYSMDCSGDVNGDGIEDLVIGAYSNDDGGNTAGKVYLIFGRSSGWTSDVDLGNADASFVGEEGDDRAGMSVSNGGDINGDGYDDIVIGADEYHAISGGENGRAYIIYGRSSGWYRNRDLSTASVRIRGEYDEDKFGESVASGGDVNGDGYDDVLIGAPRYEPTSTNYSGKAYLLLGGPSLPSSISASSLSGSFLGAGDDEYCGSSVSLSGDVNGDGLDDILIGAKYYKKTPTGHAVGRTYLLLGKRTGWSRDTTLTSPDASFIGQRMGAGWSVDIAGDLNGDGLDDIAIGEPENYEGGNNAGQTYIIFGKETNWTRDLDLGNADASYLGESAYDNSGYYVVGAGDLNLDGYDDLLIGAPRNDEGGRTSPYYAGKSYVVYGKRTGWENDVDLENADMSFIGEDGDDLSGYCVGAGGDVDSDGYPDILIGAWRDDQYGSNTGATYLIGHQEFDAVIDLGAYYRSNSTGIHLHWNDSVGDSGFYGIFRGEQPDALYRLANTTDSFYTDWDIQLGRVYYYVVVAVGPLGSTSVFGRPISRMADKDTDNDTIGNLMDWDDDGDGIPDGEDDFPLNSSEWLDTDMDGTGNNADTDDDNDGILDVNDNDPLNPLNGIQVDLDLSSLYAMITDMEGNLSSKFVYLESNLSSRLSNVQNAINEKVDGLNLSVILGFEDLRGRVVAGFDSLHQLTRGMITEHWEDMNGSHDAMMSFLWNMNMNFTEDLDEILSDLETMDGKITDPNLIISRIDALSLEIEAWKREIDGNMTAGFEIIGSSLDSIRNDLITSFNSGMDGLEQALLLEIGLLKTYIELMNLTIQFHLDSLEGILEELGISIEDAFAVITEKGVVDQKQLMDELIQLSSDSRGLEENMSAIIAHLSGLESSIEALEEINEMVDSIETIEQAVVQGDEVADDKDETGSGPAALITIVLIVIVLILIILVLILLFRIGKKDDIEEMEEIEAPRAPLKKR